MPSALLELMVRIMTHLPAEDSDLTLIVLKGHLVLEEELNSAVASRVDHPKHILDAELEFAQLLFVAKALFFRADDSWVWSGIKKLNSIRNVLAHTLEPKNLDEKLQEFVETVEKNIGVDRNSFAERLRRSIAMLAARVHRLHNGHEA